MLLLLLPAFAEPMADTATSMDAAPCEPAGVAVTRPAPGQTEVPINVHPGLVWDGACAPADQYTLTLYDGETELASDTFSFPGDRAVSHLDPEADLAPDHDYVFKVIPDLGRGVVTEVYFTTGTGVAAPLEGTPTLSFGDAFGDDASHTASVWFQIDAPAEPHDLSLWQALDAPHPERVWSAAAITDGVVSNTMTLTSWFAGDEVCLIPVVYDALGNALEGEEACVDPEPVASTTPLDCGCNGTASPVAAGLVALAALSCSRRRSAGSPAPRRSG